MRWKWVGRRRAVGLAGTVAVLLAVAGVAYATIPDSGKVYTACMLNKDGTIRLIDPSLASNNAMSHCTSRETQISWNQQGQPCAAGTAGATGPQGPAGKDGANGKDGVSGLELVSAARTFNGPFGGFTATSLSASVQCPSGKFATGGGGLIQLYNAGGFIDIGTVAGAQLTVSSNRAVGYVVNAAFPPAGVTRMVVNAQVVCITAS